MKLAEIHRYLHPSSLFCMPDCAVDYAPSCTVAHVELLAGYECECSAACPALSSTGLATLQDLLDT